MSSAWKASRRISMPRIALSFTGLCGWVTPVGAADDLHLAISPDSIHTRQPDGLRSWRLSTRILGTFQAQALSGGTVLLQATTVDSEAPPALWLGRDGRVLGALGRSAIRLAGTDRGVPGRSGCVTWDEPTAITPPPALETQSDSLEALLADRQGDVWAIQERYDAALGGHHQLRAARSIGNSGQWLPTETLHDTQNFLANISADIDADDVITVVFRDIESPDYRLLALRHDPNSGWGPPTVVDAAADFFQETALAADAAGNLVAATNHDVDGESAIHVSVYDASSGAWQPRVQVSPAGVQADAPRIVRTADRADVYLAYIVYTTVARGIYVHRWDTSTKSWSPARVVPGSSSAANSLGGVLAAAAPDALTVIWEGGPPGLRSIVGSRLVSGEWENAEILLGPDAATYLDFGAIDTSPSGRVLAMLSRFDGPFIRYWALRHEPEVGWQPAENPYSTEYAFQTYNRVRFIGDDRAIATMVGVQDSEPQLTSLRFVGQEWLGALDVPGEDLTFDQELHARAEEMLLAYVAGEVFGSSGGVYGTWLRTLAGDLDCDGCVDLTDLSTLLVDFGCLPPAACSGDLNGDGATDLVDLSLLLANFGVGCR